MKNKRRIFLCLLCSAVMFLCGIAVCAQNTSDVPTVSSVSVSSKQKGVFVRWTKAKGAEFYKIMRKTAEGEYIAVNTVTDGNSYQDDSALSGISYTYKVIPCTAEAEGVCSAEKSVVCVHEPEIISVEGGTEGVNVRWKKCGGADKYTVYFKAEGDSSWSVASHLGDTDNFTHKSAPDGKRLTYTVRARVGKAVSTYDKAGVTADYLKAPHIKSASSVINGIKISWTKTSCAESYLLYRRGAGEKWTYLTSLGAEYGSYTDTTVLPGKTYAYTVRAVRGEQMSAYTSGKAYRYIPINDVTSISPMCDGLTIRWKASPYAKGYKLYRKAEGDTSWTRIAVISSAKKLYYKDSVKENGKTYTYTLITVCGSYQSTYSKIGKSYTFVSAPEALSAVRNGNGYKVSWNKVEGATHYYIYRRADSSDSWVKLTRTGNVSEYTDKSAEKTKSYQYCVRAGKDGKFFSNYGNAVETVRIDPNKKMVALTYDDGPHNTYTNRILDVLEKYDARATFFVVGERIDSNSKPLIRAANLGCEIGNHTYNHMNIPSYSDSQIRSNLQKTDDLVRKYTGSETTVMRPPGGATSSRALKAVNKPVIMWSVDTRDWDHRNASRVVSHIKNNSFDGAIILMHDLYSSTASATETIVPWLINNGYQLVTVSELLYYRGIDARDGNVYRSARP